MGRETVLMSMFEPSSLGLEIGGSFNPLVPKSAGWPVETLDHASADDLRRKYRDDPNVDISRIEEVDHVSDGRPMAELIGKTAHYDYIVASHVIEHVTDMLGFMADCDTLLKPGGVLVLAVPDKRRCFDIFQPLSSTGDVLQAHLERRTRQPPGKVFDHYAYFALRGGQIAWHGGGDAPLAFQHDLAFARGMYDKVCRSDGYEDVHAWRFTPSSFRLIVSDLNVLGALGLRERAFIESDNVEFYVSLSRTGSGCPVDRLALARMILAEQYEMVAEDPAAPVPLPASAIRAIEAHASRLEAEALALTRAA